MCGARGPESTATARAVLPGMAGVDAAGVAEAVGANVRGLRAGHRAPAFLLVLLGERKRGLGDLRAAGGELGHCLLREPGDHPALGRGPAGPLEPEPPAAGRWLCRYGRTPFANWAMQLATALRLPALAMH